MFIKLIIWLNLVASWLVSGSLDERGFRYETVVLKLQNIAPGIYLNYSKFKATIGFILILS